MPIRTPTTKFFVALTDYLRNQVGPFCVMEQKDKHNEWMYTCRIDTKLKPLTPEQREHIKALAGNLVPAMYSVNLEFTP